MWGWCRRRRLGCGCSGGATARVAGAPRVSGSPPPGCACSGVVSVEGPPLPPDLSESLAAPSASGDASGGPRDRAALWRLTARAYVGCGDCMRVCDRCRYPGVAPPVRPVEFRVSGARCPLSLRGGCACKMPIDEGGEKPGMGEGSFRAEAGMLPEEFDASAAWSKDPLPVSDANGSAGASAAAPPSFASSGGRKEPGGCACAATRASATCSSTSCNAESMLSPGSGSTGAMGGGMATWRRRRADSSVRNDVSRRGLRKPIE